MKIKVCELCIKHEKGATPEKAEQIELIENQGVSGDIYSRGENRQVSILLSDTAREIAALPSRPACLHKFTCNMIISGISLPEIKKGSVICFKNAAIEITEVGRHCHEICKLGSCPLIEGAIFAKVIKGGIINVGDEGQL